MKMAQVTKYFVEFYEFNGSDLSVAGQLEVPSEEIAIQTARVASMMRSGTAALRIDGESGVSVMRTYGAVPRQKATA